MATECSICGIRPAVFDIPICRECRLKIAELILSLNAEAVRELWAVTEEFDAVRQRHKQRRRERENNPPEPASVAAVAWGLLELGIMDDALETAAQAITWGEAADINPFGASALEVIFDKRLAKPDFVERMRNCMR